MTKTGNVIGYQQLKNLTDITCTVMTDLNVAASCVNLLRYRMSRVNIMQISGYFQAEAGKFLRDGVSELIDGPFCLDLLAKNGRFTHIDSAICSSEKEKAKREREIRGVIHGIGCICCVEKNKNCENI